MLDELLSGQLSLLKVLVWLVGVALAITVHEFAHAKRAQLAGDPTPAQEGRVTLNPLAHLDPLGTLTLVLFGLGWGKPVPVNPSYFRRRRYDELMVSLWGPLSNILLAGLFAVLLRFRLVPGREELFFVFALVNLLLAFFNLLPVAPLDGHHVVAALLPPRRAHAYEQFSQRYGIIVLLVILLTRAGSVLFVWPATTLLSLMIGA
ncbi:MAG: site-2 protease family protein [Armatimonadetes bacterium]|nr:site-2 protease family protein [Armatimonadota bacterium]